MQSNHFFRRFARSPLAAAAVFATLVDASAAPAQAQSSQGRAVVQACAADVQTLCPGMQPGGGKILRCLYQNRTKVSAGCKEAAKSARAGRS